MQCDGVSVSDKSAVLPLAASVCRVQARDAGMPVKSIRPLLLHCLKNYTAAMRGVLDGTSRNNHEIPQAAGLHDFVEEVMRGSLDGEADALLK